MGPARLRGRKERCYPASNSCSSEQSEQGEGDRSPDSSSRRSSRPCCRRHQAPFDPTRTSRPKFKIPKSRGCRALRDQARSSTEDRDVENACCLGDARRPGPEGGKVGDELLAESSPAEKFGGSPARGPPSSRHHPAGARRRAGQQLQGVPQRKGRARHRPPNRCSVSRQKHLILTSGRPRCRSGPRMSRSRGERYARRSHPRVFSSTTRAGPSKGPQIVAFATPPGTALIRAFRRGCRRSTRASSVRARRGRSRVARAKFRPSCLNERDVDPVGACRRNARDRACRPSCRSSRNQRSTSSSLLTSGGIRPARRPPAAGPRSSRSSWTRRATRDGRLDRARHHLSPLRDSPEGPERPSRRSRPSPMRLERAQASPTPRTRPAARAARPFDGHSRGQRLNCRALSTRAPFKSRTSSRLPQDGVRRGSTQNGAERAPVHPWQAVRPSHATQLGSRRPPESRRLPALPRACPALAEARPPLAAGGAVLAVAAPEEAELNASPLLRSVGARGFAALVHPE